MKQQLSLFATVLLVLVALSAANDIQPICGLSSKIAGLVHSGTASDPGQEFDKPAVFYGGSVRFRLLSKSEPFTLGWYQIDANLRAVVDSGSIFSNNAKVCDEVDVDFDQVDKTVYGLVVRHSDGRVFRSLEPNQYTDLMLAVDIDGVLVIRVRHTDIAFAIVSEEFDRLTLARSLQEVEEAEQVPGVPLPPQEAGINCVAFNPDDSAIIQMQYLAECRDYIPLGYSETVSWPTTAGTRYYLLPSGWEVAPSTANGTKTVVGSYSKYWNAATDCWPSVSGCLDSWTYVLNSANQWCVKVTTGPGMARPILRELSVDTRCHPDNYNHTCDIKLPSRLVVNSSEIPLDPISLFVNLRGGSGVNMSIRLPAYSGSSSDTQTSIQLANVATLDLVILLDAVGMAGTEITSVGRDIFSGTMLTFARNLAQDVAPRGTNVNVAYRYWNGATSSGMSATKPVSNLVAGDFTAPATSTSSGSVLTGATFFGTSSFAWNMSTVGVGDYMRVLMIITKNTPATTFDFQPLNVSLRGAQIMPYIYAPAAATTTAWTNMRTRLPWTRLCTDCPVWTSLGSSAAPTWHTHARSEIATSSANILQSTYIYVWPNPPFLFFNVSEAYVFGNKRVIISVNDRCFCYPNVKNAPAPPPGYFYCDDGQMPCGQSTDHKIFICHVPPGNAENSMTSSVGYTAWGGHSGHEHDGVGGCDCFQWDANGGVLLSELPPSSLYQMSPDHSYGFLYVFGHDTRKTYVTVPSAPWLPQNERTITVDAGSRVVFDFVEDPNMVIDENGYLQKYQLTYVGYTGVPPSIDIGFLNMTSYPDGTPIVLSTDNNVLNRQCPQYDGTGIAFYPPCPSGVNAGKALIIRYRLCNGCFCQESGTDASYGASVLRVNVICKVEVAPYCTSTVLPTVYTYPSTGATVVVDLKAMSFDGNNDPITVTVATGSPTPFGTLTTNSSGVSTYVISPNTNGTAVISYYVSDGKATSPSCLITIPIILLMEKPEISIYPSLNFITPREENSTVYTITVRYNPGVAVQIVASNGQWVDPSYISYVLMDGNEIRNVEVPDVLVMESTFSATTTLMWRPTQYHLDNIVSSVTFTAIATDGATSTPITATFRVTPNIAPVSNNVASPVVTNEDVAVPFTVRCNDTDWYHSYKLTITPTTNTPNGNVVETGSEVNVTGYVGTGQAFLFTPNQNWNGVTSFTYTCTDPLGASVTDTVTITVLPVNDPPVSQNYTFTVIEGQRRSFTIFASDVDIIDKLAFSSTNISLVGSGSDRILLQSTQTAVASNTWLNFSVAGQASWTFDYTRPFGISTPSEVFAFVVNDGTVNSVTYYVTLVIQQQGPPSCQDVTININEDSTRDILLGQYYSATSGASLSETTILSALTTPIGGVLRTSTGSPITVFPSILDRTNGVPNPVTYVPDANAFGSTSFTYQFRDNSFARLASPVCTVTINVASVNDPPTISVTPLDATVARGSTQLFTVTITDIDSPSVTVSWADKSVPQGSTLTASNGVTTANTIGTFNIDPQTKTATFTVTWAPGPLTVDGAQGYALFTAVDSSNLAAVGPFSDDRITFRTPANLAPYHFTEVVPSIAEDQTSCGLIKVIGSDPDAVDRHALRMRIVTTTTNGVLNQTVASSYNGGWAHADGTQFDLCYIPNLNFNGQDCFTVRYIDLLGLESEDEQICITITPVNDPPTSKDIVIPVCWNSNVTFSFTGADIDGDALELQIQSDVTQLTAATLWRVSPSTQITDAYTISGTSPDNWVFEVRAGATTVNQTFTFYVFDGVARSLARYNVLVAIARYDVCANDPPVTYNGTYSVDEDRRLYINLNDHMQDDLDYDVILVAIRSPQSADTAGSLYSDAGALLTVGTSLEPTENHTILFIPAPNYCGQYFFNIRATDSAGLHSNTSGIYINVVCVNDPPTWTVTPSLVVAKRGEPGYFNYTLTDIDSTTMTIRINATQLSNVPAGSTLIIGGEVVDLTRDFSLTVQNPTPGTPVIVQASWTPSTTAPDGQTGFDWGQLRDTEGLRAPDLRVTYQVSSNIPPVAYDYTVTIEEDSEGVPIPLYGTDADVPHNFRLAPTITSTPQFGSITPAVNATHTNQTGSLWTQTYTPNPGFYGTDSYTFTYTDPVSAVSNTATVTIIVTHVNHPPVCLSQNNVRVEDGLHIVITLAASDPDVNDGIKYEITAISMANGTLVRLPGGTPITAPVADIQDPRPFQLNYTAAGVGTYTFSYRLTDIPFDASAPLQSGICTITITVQEGEVIIINNPPTPGNITIYIDEDTDTLIDIGSFIVDEDGDPIAQVIITSLPNGSLVQLADPGKNQLPGSTLFPSSLGTFPVYLIPQTDENGQTSFQYYAVDDKGDISPYPGTITIVVRPVNDPPTITVDPAMITVARTTSGSFSFTIHDKDSASLNVTVLVNNVPVQSTMVYSPAATVLAPGSLAQVYTSTGPFPETATGFFTWTPSISIPDGTIGTIQLQVTDGNATGNSQVVTLQVIPNNPPFTVSPTECLNATELIPLTITLEGSDADTFDRTTLTVRIVSLPRNGNLTFNGNALASGDDVPVTFPNDAQTGTLANVTYTGRMYYRGQDFFDFVVIDHALATSTPRTVCINFVPVDHPPVSENYVLYIEEDTCVLPSCSVLTLNPNFTQVVTFDPDGDFTWIEFTDVGSAADGRFVYQDGNTLVPVTVGVPVNLSEVRVFYQPAPDRSGDNYAVGTFVVHTEFGDSETSYTITVHVAPVNDPPIGANYTDYLERNQVVNFELFHDDKDSNVSALVIELIDIPQSNKGTFTITSTGAQASGGYIEGFNVTFTPYWNAYHEVDPIGVLTYAVWDPEGARSGIYYVNLYLGFVPFDLEYKNDTTYLTPEDVELRFQVGVYGQDYFGGNEGLTDVEITLSNITKFMEGTLGWCPPTDPFNCVPFTDATTTIPMGAWITYIGGQDLYKVDGALTFDLTLTASTGAPPLLVTYSISVTPVNDPPVLIPRFNTTASGLKNECEEDTYKIVEFEVTDIDNDPDTLAGVIVQFMQPSAPGDWYNCNDNPVGVNRHGDCMRGDLLSAGSFVPISSDDERAYFRFLYIPKPNVNGVARLLLKAQDPLFADSADKEIVEITVLPVNDRPSFVNFAKTAGKVENSSNDKWLITAEVADIDFRYGKELNVTYFLRRASAGDPNDNGNGNGNNTKRDVEETEQQSTQDLVGRGWFVVPEDSAAGEAAPCVLASDRLSITCQAKVENLNPWLRNGINLVFDDTVFGYVSVELNVNDLGNVDYRVPPPPLDKSEWLNDTILADALAAAPRPKTNNIALIAAPIAGLIAGAIIAGLIFAIKKNQAKAAVENYFDRFALGMEGATNTSPLYQGATKGGESPIYKGSS